MRKAVYTVGYWRKYNFVSCSVNVGNIVPFLIFPDFLGYVNVSKIERVMSFSPRKQKFV